MPTLYLPAAHTDTDVALAAEIASAVGSQDLYVAWTHGEGPGLSPEYETMLGDGEPFATPFAELVMAMVQGVSALWNAIVRPGAARAELEAPSGATPPARRPPAGEWSA
jgi:hypothetical protein